MTAEFDLVVVGAGAAGGIVAQVAAEAGKSVLLLERGKRRSFADSGRRDHLRNHRLSTYGHNTGPDLDGNPRVVVEPDGSVRIVRPHENGYHNNAVCVGAGTLVYGGLAWRFLPEDFRMASIYGVPAGSSMVDWPIGYNDLEPWYSRAEWEIGVSGDSRPRGWGRRSRDYPMPAVAGYEAARVLRAGAAGLGLDAFSPPLLINTVPFAGRAACIQCGSCVGFPCPSDAKNGTQNTAIPRALATGGCRLVTGAVVERVETGAGGQVTGVGYLVDEGGRVERRSVRSKAVVLSGGAIETARLMLMSASRHHPDGLGNAHDQVGRHLQGHYYPAAYGLFDHDVYDPRGPGVTIATCAFNHHNPDIVGGAMLADDFIMLPIAFWKSALPPELRRWGREAKDFMRRNFRRVLPIRGPVHEIPNPESRVRIDPAVRDRWGLPVARLSGTVHRETLRTARFVQDRACEWLLASGAARTWRSAIENRLSANHHQAGTCRMGSDPAGSVTDPWGRVWGHDNLFVCDASLHPTNGGFNPVLTIMAMAYRNASHIAAEL